MNKIKYNVGDKIKYINILNYARIGTIIKKAGIFKTRYKIEYQGFVDTVDKKDIIHIVK